ncbi:aldose epimerase family protein [Diplocloster agilis]|uniref:Aldose 1-epimerase n=1 Tax=Diplocloster agilis TaxID=2850323 RepID=A0A949JZ67_9FIRM|nr:MULTISPECIES: aldose epimerase family protein [Lachnospiraceae]MBU9736871.1 galactose mutarotase [Diplocloster agilis]MBU9743966.1 galactose mutarotase [Diplocloster agilis]MCU6733706.1 galactose mutarotase [Suonthocola fibrivorans]SCJ04450.1 Aldose 1-epimerase precursor [uncultured Clostridium sp.]
MGITTSKFQDSEATLYTMENSNGCKLTVCDYGAVLYSLLVPDRDGKMLDVALGFEGPQGYRHNDTGLGAIVGRNANRIGKAAFELNGVVWKLDQNDHGNNLHSGFNRYYERMWDAKMSGTGAEPAVIFSLHSPDGDQGFPGTADVTVIYTLTADNEVKISYHAVSDKDTVFNMTNHCYFNLNGHDSGNAVDQILWMDADAYTPTDAESIPTGEIAPVDQTPMDFRVAKRIGDEIDSDFEQLTMAGGYDHNWILAHPGNGQPFAVLKSEDSGIVMEMYTDLPGVQFYSGNYLMGETGKGGCSYAKRAGVCFETQYYPDAVNKPEFPSPVVKAGECYDTTTVYKFKCE